MSPIRVGLIGHGYVGATYHVPLLGAVDGLQLVRVATSKPQEVQHKGVAVCSSYESLAEAPDIDLVVIATPNATHADLAARALNAGKHVVVEKPFTVSSSEADALIDLAASRKRVLSAFHNRRWDSNFLTLRHVLENKMLGTVHSYEARYDRFLPQASALWRERDLPGSGTLYDLGSHLIDQTLCLFGMPRAVTAHLAAQREGVQATDYFYLRLDYAHCKAVLRSSMIVREPGPRLRVHGTHGSFMQSGSDVQVAALRQGHAPSNAGHTEGNAADTVRVVVDRDGEPQPATAANQAGDYAAYYRALRDAIRYGKPAPVTAEQARDVIRVIERAIDSHRAGRTLPIH